jgi:dolichol-phosphate mannosyltransferase
MKLSIIIPVFNEENTISQILDLVKEVKLPNGLKKEVIIVNDASTDATTKIIEKKENFFEYVEHINNEGKGSAVKDGIKKSTGDILIIQDADLEYDPKYYSILLEPILTNKCKVVYGTRLKKYPLKIWGSGKTVLPTHLIANKFLTFLTNLLYGSKLTDMETCYKVFTKDVISSISLKAKRFDFEPEITAKILKKGIVIFEVPIVVNPRTYSEGKKIGFLDGIIAIWTIIKYRFVN